MAFVSYSIIPLPALKDNYIWMLEDPYSLETVAVDPGEADPVFAYLQETKRTLNGILITHHHGDHTHGVKELLKKHSVPVYGAFNSSFHLTNRLLKDGERFSLFPHGLVITGIAIPGHTLDHMAFYAPSFVFTGDTLFSAGCGRVFEGTAPQMWNSLKKLRDLPEDTYVYCGHEYTAQNLLFAKQVDPQNQHLLHHSEWVHDQRKLGNPTLPSTIGLEKKINPFLRIEEPEVKEAICAHEGKKELTPHALFGALREWKNHF